MLNLETLKTFIPSSPIGELSSGDFVELLGKPLLTLTYGQLMAYRGRANSRGGSRAHQVFRSSGVYVIEVAGKVYIGSTGGGAQYFGRRWRLHTTSENHRCMTEFMASPCWESTKFHAISICENLAMARFLEYGVITYAERVAPSILINPKDFEGRKQRERNPVSERMRKNQILIGEKMQSLAMANHT